MKKRIISLVAAMIMLFSAISLAGCQGGEQSNDSQEAEVKSVKIGVMLYNTEPQLASVQAYLEQLAEGIDGLEFMFAKAESMDADANLSTAESLIAQGCNGIITTVGTGLIEITEACAAQDVYVALFLGKPDEADEEAMAGYDNFIGGVTDGPITGEERGVKAANYIIENGYKKVGTVSFPLSVMTVHQEAYEAFVDTIDEYNAGVSEEEKVELTDNEEVYFTQLDASYFENHTDLDCVYSLAAGIDYVYPVMVQAGVAGDVELVTTGIRFDDDCYEAINSGDIGFTGFTSVEEAFYPVAMIHQAVNGKTYEDGPENGTVVGCSTIYITGKEDLDALKENSYYFRENDDDEERMLLTPEEAKQMLSSFNENATYEELTAYLDDLGIEAFK